MQERSREMSGTVFTYERRDRGEEWGPSGENPLFGAEDLPFANYSPMVRVSRVSDAANLSRSHKATQHPGNPAFNISKLADQNFTTVTASKKTKGSKYVIHKRSYTARPQLAKSNNGLLKTRKGHDHVQKGKKTKLRNNAMLRTTFTKGKPISVEPSVVIEEDWESVLEIRFMKLKGQVSKLSIADYEDSLQTVRQCGVLYPLKDAQAIGNPTPEPIPGDKVEFERTTISVDPVMQSISSDFRPDNDKVNVFGSELVLYALMTATSCTRAFDISIKKADGNIIFDIQPDNKLYTLPINEHFVDGNGDARDPFADSATLSTDTSILNLIFNQFMKDKSQPPQRYEDLPLISKEKETVHGFSYVYRTFQLLSGAQVWMRARVEGLVEREGGDALASAFALIEHDAGDKVFGSEWRSLLDSRLATITSGEKKNNARMIDMVSLHALLSGIDYLYLGFLSKKAKEKHPQGTKILKVEKYTKKEFHTLFALNQRLAFSNLENIVDQLQGLADGHYMLVKEPQVESLRVYRVPNKEPSA